MKLHPLLNNPNAVLVSHTHLSTSPTWTNYRHAARQTMTAMQIELEGEAIVIKPNATIAERFANPDTGITTHPGFIHGMLDYLRAHSVQKNAAHIVEDPRNTNNNAPRHWRDTGFDTLATKTGVNLCCPNDNTCVKKTIPNPQAHSTLHVSHLAVAPDTVLFNIPKLKTHNLAITTLCFKNLMGLVNVFDRHYCAQAWGELPEDVQKNERPRHEWLDLATHQQWQRGLARRLIDTAQVIQPHLNIVEGIVGREGTGFRRGRNRALGLTIAGINMVAVDSVASYLMGFDPQQLIYLQMAADFGLGTNDLNQLDIYNVQADEIVPCQNLQAIRAQPPFHVIMNIADEKSPEFEAQEKQTTDFTQQEESTWHSMLKSVAS